MCLILKCFVMTMMNDADDVISPVLSKASHETAVVIEVLVSPSGE